MVQNVLNDFHLMQKLLKECQREDACHFEICLKIVSVQKALRAEYRLANGFQSSTWAGLKRLGEPGDAGILCFFPPIF